MNSENEELYSGLSSSYALMINAALTAATIVGGTVTLIVCKFVLRKAKLDLLFHDISTMGLQLMTVVFHSVKNLSFLIR